MSRALIVIDVQESFRARAEEWAGVHNPKITEPVNRLVRHAREKGDTVVWVLHSEPGTDTVFDPALGHVRLMEELDQPLPGEITVHKTSHNALPNERLVRRWERFARAC